MNNEQHRQRQLQHIRECLAECDKFHDEHEIEAALERAEADARRSEGRREPVQQTLTLAA